VAVTAIDRLVFSDKREIGQIMGKGQGLFGLLERVLVVAFQAILSEFSIVNIFVTVGASGMGDLGKVLEFFTVACLFFMAVDTFDFLVGSF